MDTKIPEDDFVPAPVPNGMNPPDVPALPMGPAAAPRFEDSVCLKGKGGRCEYLWQIVTNFAHGNPAGTFEKGKEPRAVHRSCIRASEEMPLKGLVVHSCNAHSDPEQRRDPKPFIFDEEE